MRDAQRHPMHMCEAPSLQATSGPRSGACEKRQWCPEGVGKRLQSLRGSFAAWEGLSPPSTPAKPTLNGLVSSDLPDTLVIRVVPGLLLTMSSTARGSRSTAAVLAQCWHPGGWQARVPGTVLHEAGQEGQAR